MKILIANCHRSIVGGAERYLRTIISRLSAQGHRLAILHTYAVGGNAATIDNDSDEAPKWCLQTGNAMEVLESIARWKPDLVFGHGIEPFEVEQSLVERYPFVVFLHNYSHTCPSGRKCTLVPAAKTCDRVAGPACLLLHYTLRCGGVHPIRTWRDYQLQSRRATLLPRYRAVLVGSRHMEQEVAKHGVEKARLLMLRLPPSDMEPDHDEPGWREPGGNLLVTGRLTDIKGTHYALAAVPIAAKLLGMKLQLTVAGSGPELKRLQDQACRDNIPVRFTGWIDTAEISAEMRRADLLIFPSLWPEPFGLVGIEAGCIGLPTAGFALGGSADWLIGGQTGEVASSNPPTARSLGEAIWRALRDPEAYNALRRRAWHFAQQYNIDQHMRALEVILGRVAEQKPLVSRT